MAFFTLEQLIARAKTYVDDDHNDEKSWISDERWKDIANVEYGQLYKRWIRQGLITPEPTTAYIVESDGTLQIDGVLAIVGVGKDFGDFIRPLTPAQPLIGKHAFWRGSTQPVNPSVTWAAFSQGDRIVVKLEPVPSDLVVTDETSNYVVRYIAAPTAIDYQPAEPLESEDLYVGMYDIPFGADERVVLGMARRAHLKDSVNSTLLNGLIAEADAELNFTAASKIDGIKVRRLPKRSALMRSTPRVSIWPERSEWMYF